MIVYNVTIKVTPAIAAEWLQWQLNEHGPEVVATTYFTRFSVARLLDMDDSEGPTYAVQYYAENLEAYNKYIEEFAAVLRKKSLDKWGDQFIAFRTVMQVVS